MAQYFTTKSVRDFLPFLPNIIFLVISGSRFSRYVCNTVWVY